MRIKTKSMDEIEARLLVLCAQSLKSMELVKEAIRERCRNHTYFLFCSDSYTISVKNN